MLEDRISRIVTDRSVGKAFKNKTLITQTLLQKGSTRKNNSKKNHQQSEETAHRMGKIFCQLFHKGFLSRLYEELKK